MRVLLKAIECFVLAIFFGLMPFGIGFGLGYIVKHEKKDHNNIDIE